MTGRDEELFDALGKDESLYAVSQDIRAAAPKAEPSAAFRNQLRGELVALRLRPWWRRSLADAPYRTLGLAAAVIIAGLLVVQVLPAGRGTPVALVTASSPINGNATVPTSTPITIHFNTGMNAASVDSGIRIEPATAYTTSWTGSTLTVTPDHALAADTPYVVTIAPSSLVTSSGAVSSTPLAISFTTGGAPPATPSPTASGNPSPVTSTVASVLSGATFGLSNTDALIIDGVAAASSQSNPNVTESGAPAGSPQPATGAAGTLMLYPADGSPVTLGTGILSFARSPSGETYAVVTASGKGYELSLSSPGTAEEPLIPLTTPTAVSWLGASTVIVTQGTSVEEVNTSTLAVTTVALLPQGASLDCPAYGSVCAVTGGTGSAGGASPAHSPGAAAVPALAPDSLVSLSTFDTLASLTSSDVAFSPDGSEVIWEGANGLFDSSTTSFSPVAVPTATGTLDTGSDALAVSDDGSRVALTVMTASGEETIVESGGTVLDTFPGDTDPYFDATGLTLWLTNATNGGTMVLSAGLPAEAAPTWNLPSATRALISSFISHEIKGTPLTPLPAKLPDLSGFDSGTNVDAAPESGGGYTADLRFIAAPTSSYPAGEYDHVTVRISSTSTILSVTADAPTNESSGPHILLADETAPGVYVVGFDGDLSPSTLGSCELVSGGSIVPSAVTYNASLHELVIVALSPASSPDLVITTGLEDINGVALAHDAEFPANVSSAA